MEFFKCEFCDKEFSKKGNLETHMKSVKFCLQIQQKEVDKLFSCGICDKNFNRKDVYTRHLKIHGIESLKLFEQEEKIKTLEKEISSLKSQIEIYKRRKNSKVINNNVNIHNANLQNVYMEP